MSIIYLNNFISDTSNYSGGGDSKYYMNLIINEIVPYLDTAGIEYVRVCSKDFQNTFNIKKCNLYISLASGNQYNIISQNKINTENINIFYTEGNCESKRASEIFADNINTICKKNICCTTSKMPFANHKINKDVPSVIIHIGSHKSNIRSKWIRENIENIALNISLSICEFLSIPFCGIQKLQNGKCRCKANIMSKPNLNSGVVSTTPENCFLKILGQWEDWFIVNCTDCCGYIQSKYVSFNKRI